MKFNIGDHVRVKSWDELVEEFGLAQDGSIDMPGTPMLKGSMADELCGLEFTFEGLYVGHRTLHVGRWFIGEDALELASDESEEQTPQELLDFLSGYKRAQL